MTEISISEFRNNIKYYSKKVQEEDLLIMNNGKPIMKVTNPNKNKLLLVDSLLGSVPADDEKKILKNKLNEL